MLRLLTRESRMRTLYKAFLKGRSQGGVNPSAAKEILARIRSMLGYVDENSQHGPPWLVRRRFERFQRAHRQLGDSDPTVA